MCAQVPFNREGCAFLDGHHLPVAITFELIASDKREQLLFGEQLEGANRRSRPFAVVGEVRPSGVPQGHARAAGHEGAIQWRPRRPEPQIRCMRDATEPAAELMVGQPGLIPWFAEMPTLTYSTCNVRSEDISQKLTYKDPWRYGKRGIIPALSFEGPCWETGRNVWWRLWRADGKPWGLAGLWNTLTDEASCDIHESHIMMTINADAHPLLAGMHMPDSNLGPNRRGNRGVITVAREGVYPWLYWTIEGALHLLRLKPAEHFDAVARR